MINVIDADRQIEMNYIDYKNPYFKNYDFVN